MKIVTVNNTADIYGASRCMERVFRRFIQSGHEVHVVLPERGPLAGRLEAQGFFVHIHKGLCVIDRARMRTIGGCLKFALSLPCSTIWLALLFLKLRPTVVHTNTIVMPTPALAARLTGRRHIWHVRELLGEFGALWKPFQRFVYVFSGTIIAISNCTRDQFETPLRDKIRVIYDGLDETSSVALHDLRPSFRAGLPEFALLVGVVGRIKFHRKGQEILVRAASLLRRRHPEARYLVIGSASPGNEDQVLKLRRLIDELGVGDIVSLPGEFDDPPSIFSALDIAVVPSVQPEPFGCVVMEAMAVGTPVIGSDCGGIAEQIVDGQSGLLFAPGNAQALADSLDRLLSDPSFCRELAVNARHRVKTCFSLNATYQLLAEVVQGVDTMRHAAMRT